MIISKINLPLDYQNDPFWLNNFHELRNHILLELGLGIVTIELTESMLNLAIADAIAKYHSYIPQDYHITVVKTDLNGYADIPAGVEKHLIHDIIFTRTTLQPYIGTFAVEDFGLSYAYGLGNNDLTQMISEFDVVGYWMYRQKLKDIQKSLAIDRTWEIIDNKIKVFPSRFAMTTPTDIGIVHGKILSIDEIEQEDWIRDYSVAKSKTILGGNRMKLSGYSLAGQSVSTDGESLKSEGKEKMAELMEQIKQMRPAPDIFIF